MCGIDALPCTIDDILHTLDPSVHHTLTFFLYLLWRFTILWLLVSCFSVINQSAFISFIDFFTFFRWVVHGGIHFLLEHRVVFLILAGEDHPSIWAIVYALLLGFDDKLNSGHFIR